MGKVIWLTGESGAGKSAVANEIRDRHMPEAVILDGDQMRDSISLGAGFSRGDRAAHNLRVARLARELSKQTTVIVAVIAPMREVRESISEICHPLWIYIERTLPEREGHFYEKPDRYLTVNHDELSIRQSTNALMEFMNICALGSRGLYKYSLFIGRYQPLHDGHKALIQSVLDEGKPVCIALRNTRVSETDPYSAEERRHMFVEAFPEEVSSSKMKIIVIPDIEEVCYGRKVGWGIRQVELDPEVEAISATEIRAKGKQDGKLDD